MDRLPWRSASSASWFQISRSFSCVAHSTALSRLPQRMERLKRARGSVTKYSAMSSKPFF